MAGDVTTGPSPWNNAARGPRLFLSLPGRVPAASAPAPDFGAEDAAYRDRFLIDDWRLARHEARLQLARLLDTFIGNGEGGQERVRPPLFHDRWGRPCLGGKVPLGLSFTYAVLDGRPRACCLLGFHDNGSGRPDETLPPPSLGVDACGLDEEPVADVALHSHELAALARLRSDPGAARAWRALFWTVKEAALKAHGTGLAFEPAGIDVTAGMASSPAPGAAERASGMIVIGGVAFSWRAVPCEGCALVVAWDEPPPACLLTY